MHTVVLVDDHRLVRAAVKRLLSDAPGISIVSEAEGVEPALEAARRHRPDVVLLSINTPAIGSLDLVRRLQRTQPSIKVVILSIAADRFLVGRMLKAGAVGCVTKSATPEDLLAAVEAACRGERYLSPELASALAVDALSGEGRSPFEALSARELQVLMLVTEGQRIHDISNRLCLSPKTVSTYRTRLFTKLGVRSDVELIRLAVQHGLVRVSSYH